VTIVVVDDGSKDATAREVQVAISHGLPMHLIRLSRNFGKEVALTAGLVAAERLEDPADVVLIMDADFQHPLSAVMQMIERWESGVDMVYGVQRRREAVGPVRRWLTRAFYGLLTSSSDPVLIPRDAGDFRLLDQKVVRAINQLRERNRYMKGLYAWVGFGSEGIPYAALPRMGGTSTFGLRRLTELALDGITAFTSWPLRVASICGVVISSVAFL
jgi:glycosyltransferase involved in cell wall biosynthesis